jgi:serine/threonine protein kinase
MSGGLTPSGADPAAFAGVPAVGALIAGKYQVERLLGAGGMGIVVAARHLQLGQLVAVKFMRLEATKDANAVNRFLREARSAAALSSEHVTRVLDVGTLESGAPFMVMEYLAGADLRELLETNGPLSIPDAVGAVLQACEAIAEAHELGIIHRDLKPSNLFVTRRRDGTPLVKVLDFGISKKIELNTQGARESLTVSGAVIGSPLYMSPEQLRSAKAADARSDIWSLGVILYELLTARAPFGGETLGEVLARIVSESPQPIRQQRPDLPEALAALITQCLDRDVTRRVQSVGELMARLAPFATGVAALQTGRPDHAATYGAPPRVPTRSVQAPFSLPAAPVHATPIPATEANPSVPPVAETGPAWLKSGSSASSTRPPVRGKRALAISAVCLAFSAGFAGVYRFQRGGWPRGGAGASASTTEIGVASAAVSLAPFSPPPLVPPPANPAPGATEIAPQPQPEPPPPLNVGARILDIPAPPEPRAPADDLKPSGPPPGARPAEPPRNPVSDARDNGAGAHDPRDANGAAPVDGAPDAGPPQRPKAHPPATDHPRRPASEDDLLMRRE